MAGELAQQAPREGPVGQAQRGLALVGVEVGQLLALGAILIAMGYWRRTAGFLKYAYTANVLMMTAGFVLAGYQLTGYFVA